jgi:hypothetical protein
MENCYCIRLVEKRLEATCPFKYRKGSLAVAFEVLVALRTVVIFLVRMEGLWGSNGRCITNVVN